MTKIPEMQCLRECGQCCGPVAFSPVEVAKLEAAYPFLRFEWTNFQGNFIPTESLKTGSCTFLDVNKDCTIHEHRPLLCRLFGVVDTPKMTCPYVEVEDKISDPMAQRLLADAGMVPQKT